MSKNTLLLIAVLYGPLSGSAVVSLLRVFSNTYNISIETASLVIPLYTIPFAVMQLFSGAIADAFSRKKALIFGLVFFGLSSILIAFSPTIEFLLMARFIQGLFASFQIPIVIAIIGDTEDSQRGRAFGILSVFINLGLALGPLLAGLLEVYISWKIFFGLLGISAICNAILLQVFFDYKSPNIDTSKFDSFRTSFSYLKQAGTNSQVWLFSLAGMFGFAGLVATYIYLPTYIVDLEYTQDIAGFIISVSGLVGMFFGPISGKSVDNIGRKQVILFGFSIVLIAELGFGLIFVNVNPPVLMLAVIFMGLIGIGNAFSQAANNTMATEIIPELRATVASFSAAFRFMAFAALSFLFPIYITYGFEAIMFISIGCIIIGSILFLPFQTLKIKSDQTLSIS
ncbi:MAG: MFS transporter [Candidatus Hodarchaeales archaeon]